MNSTNFNPKASAQIKEKEALLDLLKTQSLTGRDVSDIFGWDSDKAKRYLVSLKYYKLIAQQTEKDQPNRLIRKFYAISNDSFERVLRASLQESVAKKVQTRLAIEEEKRTVKDKQAKKVAGVTVVTSNDYHTKGNKSRLNKWHGYSSFEHA